MKDTTVVIPTYWCPSAKDNIIEEKIFDDPTHVYEEGTLGRILDSFSILRDKDFTLVIIISSTAHEIEDEVIEKVKNIISPFNKRYDIKLLYYYNLIKLKERLLAENVSEDACNLINLDNYSSIRNICSIAGILNDSEITVFIDDDEVFTDEYFLERAREFIGKKHNGHKIEAVAGYYVQSDNNYRLDEKKVPGWKREHWNNVIAMNKAFDRIISSSPRLNHTTFVFGGNMVIHKGLLMNIPFDPKITRGEDIDFLINVRINKINFWLDNELYIKHLPPAKKQPQWLSFREDIKRFLYERKKVMDHSDIEGVSIEDLMPYPGVFIGEDLEQRIIKANKLLCLEYKKQGKKEDILECEKNIEFITNSEFSNFDTRTWLADLTSKWKEVARGCLGKGINEDY